MDEKIDHKYLQYYRKFNDVCNNIKDVGFSKLDDKEVFEACFCYELCMLSKAVCLFSNDVNSPAMWLIYRKRLEDISIIIQSIDDKGGFEEENYLLFKIAINNRFANQKERKRVGQKFNISRTLVNNRINDDDFFLFQFLTEDGKISSIIQGVGNKFSYRIFGVLTHNYLITTNELCSNILKDQIKKNKIQCLNNVKEISKKYYKECSRIITKNPENELEKAPLIELINNYIFKPFKEMTRDGHLSTDILLLKIFVYCISEICKLLVTKEYALIILSAKANIELISVCLVLIKMTDEERCSRIDAYNHFLMEAILNKSNKEHNKKVYDEEFKNLVKDDFYTFCNKVKNPLYCIFLNDVTFTSVAKNCIKEDKDIFGIYLLSCRMVHSYGQMIKYKDDLEFLSIKLLDFVLDKTDELIFYMFPQGKVFEETLKTKSKYLFEIKSGIFKIKEYINKKN